VGNYFLQFNGRIKADGPPGINVDSRLDEKLWALPIDRKPSLKFSSPDERILRAADREHAGASTESYRTITFLDPDYISLDDLTDYEGGVHPDADIKYEVLPLDSLGSEAISIGAILGEGGREAFRRALEAGSKKSPCGEPKTTDERNWKIFRKSGHWTARGWASTHRLWRFGFEFDIPVALPRSLVGPDELRFDFQEITKQVSGARDAFSAPGQDLLVVLKIDELLVFEPHGRTLGNPRARAHLRGEAAEMETGPDTLERPVMAQWAIGRHVQRWTAQITALLKSLEAENPA